MTLADHHRAAAILQAGGEARGFVPFRAESVEGSITARFREQVERHPSHVAVRTDNSAITYGELNRFAGRVAAAVARHGRRNVVLLCEPGVPAIAAMLGVLNAGRAYVPLDPSFPPLRLQQILDDVEAEVIIADTPNYTVATSLHRPDLSVLLTHEIENGGDEFYAADIAPDDLAYIVYTSGSTGTPKGVAQSHRNLLHFIRSYTNSLRVGPDDRLSLVCPLSFSAAFMDIYGSMLCGATLCPYDVKRRGSADLADWIDRQGITVFHSVPTLFRQLTLALERDRCLRTVRVVDLGGETVHARDVALYRSHFSHDCVLVNHLACSEASVLAHYYIDHDCEVGTGSIPAGPPADGITVHVVGPDGEALPPGEIGELVIESRYVSPGTWREFAPASPAPSASRTLHTGDLGRVRTDGMLDYLGRRGSRVKIRGNRVEPAEVERALLEVDGVREAVVVDRPARGADSDGAMLVAYVTSRDGRVISVEKLRAGMAARLPDFMIPSAFVHLASMPLTTTGKIDRRALPEPSGQRPTLDRPFLAPSNDVEQRLVTLWSQLLGLDRIGIDDDFFDLGGDSLLAVQLMVRIEHELGWSIPPLSLVSARTVRLLAARIAVGGAGGSGEWERVHVGNDRPPLFCFPGIAGFAFGFRDLCAIADPYRPGYALHYPGVYGGEAPLTRVEELAERALSGLRSIQPRGAYHLCGYSFGGLVAYEVACQLRAQGHDVALLALLDTHGPAARPRPFLQRLLVHAQLMRSTGSKLDYLRERAASVGRRSARVTGPWGSQGLDAPLSTPALREVERACVQAARVYRPRPYPGRVTAFRSPGHRTLWIRDPQFGWGEVACGGVDVYEISAPHAEILRPQYVRGIADQLKHALAATTLLQRDDHAAIQ